MATMWHKTEFSWPFHGYALRNINLRFHGIDAVRGFVFKLKIAYNRYTIMYINHKNKQWPFYGMLSFA